MGLYRSKNITAARKTLQRWFGLYIRIRDMDPDTGMIECFTCGKKYPFGNNQIDCSHWIESSIDATRANEFNSHACCKRCNTADNGMAAWHGEKIRLYHGEDVYKELLKLSKSDKKFSIEETMEIAREYKQMAEEMAEEKGIEI